VSRATSTKAIPWMPKANLIICERASVHSILHKMNISHLIVLRFYEYRLNAVVHFNNGLKHLRKRSKYEHSRGRLVGINLLSKLFYIVLKYNVDGDFPLPVSPFKWIPFQLFKCLSISAGAASSSSLESLSSFRVIYYLFLLVKLY